MIKKIIITVVSVGFLSSGLYAMGNGMGNGKISPELFNEKKIEILKK